MLGVLAKVTVKPEHVDRFWKYLEADVLGSRAEPGCVRFDVLRDQTASHVYYLYEVYRDRAAYESHQKEPHFTTFFSEAGDTLAGAPEVYMADVVGVSDR
jgi:autoinducer 2-degrading protein